MILSLVITTQAALAIAEVKSSAIVNKSTVTLGDLLDNLDRGHDIWVMNSPAPGEKTSLSTKYLASLTRQHKVYWQNSRGVRQITVTRKGKVIKHEALENLIKEELDILKLSDRKSGIRFDNKNAAIHLPGDSSIDDITVQSFNFDKKTGKFTANISVPAGDGSYNTAIVRGRTHAISYVPALNKVIAPGKQITEQDLTWVSQPTRSIGRNIIRNKSQLIGMTPRRGLNPGLPLRPSDLTRPEIVIRGKLVSIHYKSGKISLTAIGKAIEGGGRGDVIRVMNSKSHKTIEAVVTGPGQVQVITAQFGIAQLNVLQ
jgi:flagella basal body P-ring formation protein FlgA